MSGNYYSPLNVHLSVYGVSPAHTAYIRPEKNTRHVKPTEIAIKVLSAICRGVYST